MVVGLIAGGEIAIRSAVENAEDDAEAAGGSLRELDSRPTTRCRHLGFRRTPYVVGGLNYARSVGAFTAAIASNADSEIGAAAEVAIEVVTGPEFISGSTRLKAGTAQKLVVNMLTTLSMISSARPTAG